MDKTYSVYWSEAAFDKLSSLFAYPREQRKGMGLSNHWPTGLRHLIEKVEIFTFNIYKSMKKTIP